MRLLVASAGNEGESEFMVVHERKKREKNYRGEGGEMKKGRQTRRTRKRKA
jgi:hypothetical protein